MSYHFRIEVSCPKCIQSTVVDGKKIPKGKLKVVCRKCCHQFPMNSETGLNCKIRTLGGALTNPTQQVPQSLEWLVDARMCKGFRYDIKGLGVLARGGVINRHTLIKPPDSDASIPAGRLLQLKPYFDDADKAGARQTDAATNTDATLEGQKSPADSKAWYQMDCSDFFEEKLVPFLARDQKKDKRAAG